jgi:hypothetical protein
MAVNDPKWSNGSIVLLQSTDVAWSEGSALLDFYSLPAQEVSKSGLLSGVSTMTGSLIRSAAHSVVPLAATAALESGAFLNFSYSTTLEATTELTGSPQIGIPFIETNGVLEATAELSYGALIKSFAKDASEELTAVTSLTGGAYHNCVIVAAALEAVGELLSISGTGFVEADGSLEAMGELTGDGAGYVEKSETLAVVGELLGNAVVSQVISAAPLEAESSITGERTPLGSVSVGSILTATAAISAQYVQSVSQEAGELLLTASILGTPIVQHSVIITNATLSNLNSLTSNLEILQFVLKGNFRKTDVVSILTTDIVKTGGSNATQ